MDLISILVEKAAMFRIFLARSIPPPLAIILEKKPLQSFSVREVGTDTVKLNIFLGLR